MDTGSILGVPALRPSFLDHVSAACSKGKARNRTAVLGDRPEMNLLTLDYKCDDDPDEDPDEDDEFGEDDEENDDDDEDEEDIETWQVSSARCVPKVRTLLDFPDGNCLDLPRFQLS